MIDDNFKSATYDDLKVEISDLYMGETGDLCRDYAKAIITIRQLRRKVADWETFMDHHSCQDTVYGDR